MDNRSLPNNRTERLLTTDQCACSSAAETELLVKSDMSWNGKPYELYPAGRPKLTVVKMTIPAHSRLPWHTHPMPNAAYILSGHLTVEDQATGKTRTIHAGEAFTESVDDIHRGYTGAEPTVVIVTYAGIEGQPLSVTVNPSENGHY